MANFTPPTSEISSSGSRLQSTTSISGSVSGSISCTPGYRGINKTVMSLNGVNDYLVFLDAVLEGIFTVDIWIYIHANAAPLQCIISQGVFYLGIRNGKVVIGNGTEETSSSSTTEKTWMHIALVRNGSLAKVYLDGVQVVVHSNFVDFTREPMVVGSSNSASFLNGYVDAVRVRSGEAWTANFTPPVRSDYISDDYWDDVVLLIKGETPVFPPDPDVKYTVFQMGMTSYNNSTFTNYDDCGNRGVTFVGNAKIVNNHFRNLYPSIPFDGKNDAIVVTHSSSLLFTPSFTFDFWCLFNPIVKMTLFDKRTSDTQTGFLVYINTDGKLYVKAGDSSAPWDIEVTSAVIAAGWHHFAIVRNSSDNIIKLYVDGVQSGNTVTSAVDFSNTANLVIGRNISSIEYFRDCLCEIRFTQNQALYTGNFTPPSYKQTPINDERDYTSLLLHFDSYPIVDSSRYNNTINEFGSPTISTTQSKFGGSSLYLNGSSGLIVPYKDHLNLGEGDFTIDFWMRPSITGVYSILGNWMQSSSFSGPWWVFLTNGSSILTFYWYVYSAGTTPLLTSTTAFSANTWYHIAVTRENDLWRLWINGAVESQIAYTGNFRSGYKIREEQSYQLPVAIGDYFNSSKSYGTANADFNGYIDEVRIVKGRCLFQQPFSVPTAAYNVSSQYPYLNTNTTLFIDVADDFSIKDETHKKNIVTLEGGIVAGQGIGGSIAYFDGVGDAIRFTSTAGDVALGYDDFTIEFWINPINGGYGGQAWGRVLETEQASTAGGFCVIMGNNGTTAACPIYLQDSKTVGQEISINTTDNIPNAAWTHVAFTRESGLFSSYVNGILKQRKWSECCFDVSQKSSSITLSSGNKTATCGNTTTSGVFTKAPINSESTTGVYFEFLLVSQADKWSLGVAGPLYTTGLLLGATSDSWAFVTSNGSIRNNSVLTAWASSTAAANDVFSIAIRNKKMWVAKNGVWLMSGDPVSEANPAYSNLVGLLSVAASIAGGTGAVTIRTNPSEFTYSLPIGYVSLNEGCLGQPFTKNRLSIGCNNSNLESFYGYLDDLRITKCKSRYSPTWSQKTLVNDPSSSSVVLLLNCEGSNNGTVFTDSSNSGKTVTSNSVMTRTDQYRFGSSSALFDGSTAYLSTTDSTDWEYASSDFTIELWYKMRVVPTTGSAAFISQWETASNNAVIAATKTAITFSVVSGGSTLVNLTCSTTHDTSVWHHLSVCRTGSTIYVYLDALQIGTASIAGAFPNISAALEIGRSNGSSYFNGWMDDIRITKGTCRYPSEFSFPQPPVGLLPPPRRFQNLTEHSILATNLQAAFSPAKFDIAMKCLTADNLQSGSNGFEASQSYSLVLNKHNFTFEGWFHPLSSGTMNYVFVHGYNAGGGYSFFVSQTSIGMRYDTGFDITATVSITGWNHIAFQRSGNLRQIYLNGVKVAETTYDTTLSAFAHTTEIGSPTSASSKFYGYIDGLRFTRGVARYSSTFTPPTEAFSRYKSFPNTKSLTFFNRFSEIPMNVKRVGNPQIVRVSGVDSGGGAWFNGNSDFIQLPPVTGVSTEDFTVEFWVELHLLGTLSQPIWIWAQANNLLDAGMIAIQSKSDRLYLTLFETSNDIGSILPYTWNHVAVTRKAGLLRAFLNGVKSYEASYPTLILMNTTLGLVNNETVSANENRFRGLIDNFRILKNVVLYETNFTPSKVLSSQPEDTFKRLYDPGNPLEIGKFNGTLDEVMISTEATSLSAEKKTYDDAMITVRTPERIISEIKTKVVKAPWGFHSGTGRIWGTVKSASGSPLMKRVILEEYWSHRILDETVSDPITGYYEFTGLDTQSYFTVIAEDSLDYRYNDIIRAKCTAS